MIDDAPLVEALTALEAWVHQASERAEHLSAALLAGSRAVAHTRRSLGQPAREEGAAALLLAFGEIAAEHAGLKRALEGADERLAQLAVRLDPTATAAL